ncbi:hypothetical protein GCM10008938_40090 [Deinococcus roseus]|uniref:Lipoyl-binding domain-containing protein n=1 Tax=Deinococcus roseus TaxID=392414 RepID=A0ABQ2DAI8_9DEIO|nr:hypothetical protein GCM10008938_40090 [Deinococcus roseus]
MGVSVPSKYEKPGGAGVAGKSETVVKKGEKLLEVSQMDRGHESRLHSAACSITNTITAWLGWSSKGRVQTEGGAANDQQQDDSQRPHFPFHVFKVRQETSKQPVLL